jgi:hypothetical protein
MIDGITHDYTRKQSLVWEQIFLPVHTPREWSVLLNAVEASEKSKDRPGEGVDRGSPEGGFYGN